MTHGVQQRNDLLLPLLNPLLAVRRSLPQLFFLIRNPLLFFLRSGDLTVSLFLFVTVLLSQFLPGG